MKLEVPISEDVVDELREFWGDIFGGPGDMPKELFLGAEQEHIDTTVYVERREGRLAGTCFFNLSRATALGGFGGVATSPELRRTGIGTRLSGEALEDFLRSGGEALFLGTGEANAARLYYRLGWRRLANTNVMANIAGPRSPEEFLVDYFRAVEPPITIGPATTAVRTPMIPLLVMPHDLQVLDANPEGMFSTRHRLQPSCGGLYAKYDTITKDDGGAWFAASAESGQVVGLSSVRLDGSGGCHVDGFAHAGFLDSWTGLLGSAIDWGSARGASTIVGRVSVEDHHKRALFESLGFRDVREGDAFQLGDRLVGSRHFQLN